MGRLKILAGGNSPQAQAQARGKLFERLMADVLRHYGYQIDQTPSVNYAGMEIDIEGKSIATNIPLYAECKCYESEVKSSELQAFSGKYITRWFKDNRCQGLFIALPGVNSHTKAFYRENIETNSQITVRLFEEAQVLEAIFGTQAVVSPDNISRLITPDVGKPGDSLLLYTDKGLFWVQYVIPPGGGLPSGVALFDASGSSISDKATIEYLAMLSPEIGDFNKIIVSEQTALQRPNVHQDVEEIVEVRGSSACFEYQFPASPEHFVGRHSVLKELDSFLAKVINKEISSRGILFEANSGWGKSSVVLASVARLKEKGHFAVAIDSRSAASSQFILRVVDYVLKEFRDFGGLLSEKNNFTTVTGFDGAVKALLNVGKELENNRKVLFVFLDQFENVFLLHETLKRITDMLLKVCDIQTNVVLGFSWKKDFIGLTSEFPYQLRDTIMGLSNRIVLETFSEVETTALLNKLRNELKAPLRKDLKFFLSEFSQGYPWLLKKLCAHVKAQREDGVPQSDIANSLLNVEELFQQDLRGLPPVENDTLRRIAKSAPISISDLGEDLKIEVVKSLVNRRLVVSIGHKFDVYWDIFRDYLNSGRIPVQENYILRVQIGSMLKATRLLASIKSTIKTSKFQQMVDFSKNSFYNLLRDMRLLGLIKIDSNNASLKGTFYREAEAFEEELRIHLKEKLPRNRLVRLILDNLETNDNLNLNMMSGILSESCPYISATNETWLTYARIFADWMDFADLTIFDKIAGTITRYRPGTEVRDRRPFLIKRRAGIIVPRIQYAPIEKLAIRLVQALEETRKIDVADMKKSSIEKSWSTLEDLEFIRRKPKAISVSDKLREFVSSPEKRPSLFAEGALKMKSFVTFVDMLKAYKNTGRTLILLATELREKLGADWTDETAKTNAKIMLNWARSAKIAPGVFAESWRMPNRDWKKKNNKNLPLFSSIDKE